MMAEQTEIKFRGHRPSIFKGQKAAILKELRDSGYRIENKTERVGRQVHGALRLVARPREEVSK